MNSRCQKSLNRISTGFVRGMGISSLCLAFVLSLSFMGCFQNSSNLPGPSPLRVQLVNEPMSLDPLLVEDGVALLVLNNIWNGLVGYDAAGKIENRIAESYTISNDQKKYTFTLKKDAQWSDGVSVRAQDFVTALKRVLSPQTLSKMAPYFYSIRDVREEQGRLVIELHRPTAYLIHLLTLPAAFPIRSDILDRHQGRWPEDAPTTGIYQLVSHKPGQSILLESKKQSDGGGPIQKVQLDIITDESTGVHLFEKEKLDILMRVPSFDFLRLKKQGKIQTTPFLATYYISFNCQKEPFNHSEWRKAVAGAIRREEITQILGNGEQAAWSWIPLGLEGYVPFPASRSSVPPVFSKSVEWAKSQNKPQGEITAAFDTGSRNSRVMEKIQQDLTQTLGLSVSLMNLDWKTYSQTLHTQPPHLFRYGRLSPFLDPIPHLRAFVSGDPNNDSRCTNRQYDSLVKEIEQLKPGSVRTEKIKLAQKILLEDEAFVVPIYHYVQNTGVSSRVKNFKMNPFGVIRFQDLSF
jgi:ABC-type oligopeptide transport system substrate-binding subunit